MQACDNEKLVRYVVRDVFNQFGLNTNFMAKPIVGVAGNGEHTHIGVCAKLKNGKMTNLFSPIKMGEEFLTPIGFGALMGILKNYEAMNPFVSSTNDSLNRLKPGYEAPVCIVTSLGHDPKDPSRNRTVLIGLIRSSANPMATRFELRAPNPKSNTYLVLAVSYMAMIDGIKAALGAEKTANELELSLSKKCGDADFYLEKDREYRSEKDVFEDFSEEERTKLFGKAPQTVWENLKGLSAYPEKAHTIMGDGVITPISLESYEQSILSQWKTELHNRIIPNHMTFVRECRRIHGDDATDYDLENWAKIDRMRHYIAKDSLHEKSLLTRASEALDKDDYDLASDLQIEMSQKIEQLRKLYLTYKRNLF